MSGGRSGRRAPFCRNTGTAAFLRRMPHQDFRLAVLIPKGPNRGPLQTKAATRKNTTFGLTDRWFPGSRSVCNATRFAASKARQTGGEPDAHSSPNPSTSRKGSPARSRDTGPRGGGQIPRSQKAPVTCQSSGVALLRWCIAGMPINGVRCICARRVIS
jgi:hypothetical protein